MSVGADEEVIDEGAGEASNCGFGARRRSRPRVGHRCRAIEDEHQVERRVAHWRRWRERAGRGRGWWRCWVRRGRRRRRRRRQRWRWAWWWWAWWRWRWVRRRWRWRWRGRRQRRRRRVHPLRADDHRFAWAARERDRRGRGREAVREARGGDAGKVVREGPRVVLPHVESGKVSDVGVEFTAKGRRPRRRAVVRDRAGATLLVANASAAVLDEDEGVGPAEPVLPGSERCRVHAGLQHGRLRSAKPAGCEHGSADSKSGGGRTIDPPEFTTREIQL